MNTEEIRDYALLKPAAEESFPFGGNLLVFKVSGKMFLLIDLERKPVFINLKNTPEKNLQLREDYSSIQPGWHQNKKHWNSVFVDDLPAELLRELIDDSYNLVVKNLTKKQLAALQK